LKNNLVSGSLLPDEAAQVSDCSLFFPLSLLILTVAKTLETRGAFLESPGNFSGPELHFKIKIYRIVA